MGNFLLNSPPKDVQLIQKRLEEIDLQFFQHLSENDILFIDSTHVVKLGSDVEYLFFHVLPCLNKGVIIHFHDIFYPFNYPEKWAKNQRYFWNEQYFLQTFLMYNNSYKILLCNSMVNHWETPYLKSNLKSYRQEKENPGSIWLIKVQ